ncbi:LysR substrate-binding domain-containing protein [Streptomyces sp. NBC_00184]|uniref:LysR substrate-binding domain-containing protein n=1 Tax=Streptomyces sp. NBC_00184 TaxID=2975673 RepID=UPI003FA6F031
MAIRPGNENYPGLRKRHLLQDRFVAVASPRYLAESAPLQRPGDLLRHTLLHDEFESLIPDQVDWKRWVRRHGTIELSQAAGAGPTYSHSYLTIEAALRGHGVALQSRVLVQNQIDTGELAIVLPDTETPGPYGLSLFTGVSPQPTPSVLDLVAWLVAEAQSFEENWNASPPPGVSGQTG